MPLLLAQHQPGADAAHGGGPLVLDLLVILAAASLVTLALRRVRLATIPGYLITGAALGVLVDALGGRAGVLTNPENVESIASLATILLLFTIGLHMDLGSIRSGMVHIFLLGTVSTLAVALAGWPLAMLFGLSAPAALAVSMALSISSTAVVLQVLQNRREAHRIHGRVVFGVLIVQDLLALVFLAALPPLAGWAGGTLTGAAAEAEQVTPGAKVFGLVIGAVVGVAGIALMIVLGRLILPRLLREAAKESSTDALLVLSAAIALGAAVATSALGFSPELGAFLAGFLLASTPFRAHIAGQLAPMRDLFMAVFFTVIGLHIHLLNIASGWWVILLGLVAMILLKIVVNGIVAWAFGASSGVAAAVALALAQAGEFSLVILASAGDTGILTSRQEALAIAVAVVSLVAAPWLFDLIPLVRSRVAGLRAAPWITRAILRDQQDHPGAGESPDERPALSKAGTDELPTSTGHVIIAGFGVVGRAVADQFELAGVPFTVVELNPGTVRRQAQLGRSIVYGDISNPEVLQAAEIGRADAVVLTIPDDDAVFRACRAIRALAPQAFIAVRTGYLSSAFRATGLGADHVTVAEVATAEAMARQVMQQMQRRGHIPPGPQRAGIPAGAP